MATIVCVVTLFSVFSILAFAATPEGITPYLNNPVSTSTSFSIDSSGNARVVATYESLDNVGIHATIKIKIQKQFLFFFWTDVIEWTDESTERYYAKTFTTPVDGGTYKAIVEYTIRGTAGEPDVITDEIQRTY